jgi:hypothetical protein
VAGCDAGSGRRFPVVKSMGLAGGWEVTPLAPTGPPTGSLT